MIASDLWRIETSTHCAGVAFFTFLSVFPALVFIVALSGLLQEQPRLTQFVNGLRFVLPDSALSVLTSRIHDLLAGSNETLGFGLVTSAAVALWTGSRAFRGLLFALSVVQPGPRSRSAPMRWLVSLLFMCAAAVFLIVGIVGVALVPPLAGALGVAPRLIWLRWPAMLLWRSYRSVCCIDGDPSSTHPPWLW
ncbi:YihY/virulence factor BrkB family protein [Devosia sp. PTR5]|uniref:YihY/virulence factor BrkB family protein n=2 Tax=Devosia oryzisoli TaxID=2774138 RepID=A0A927FY05_9HYPH|nr:YihY/virulence factor BrkB family protein [Devosia oryzisoli]